jgi:hypothetical protein
MSRVLRWSLWAAFLLTSIAHRVLVLRFGWWPAGALSAVVPAALIAIAVTLQIRDRRAARGGR